MEDDGQPTPSSLEQRELEQSVTAIYASLVLAIWHPVSGSR